MRHRSMMLRSMLTLQITCLYDMDIPWPDNFNETYLYEGTRETSEIWEEQGLTSYQNSWSAIWQPSSAPANH